MYTECNVKLLSETLPVLLMADKVFLLLLTKPMVHNERVSDDNLQILNVNVILWSGDSKMGFFRRFSNIPSCIKRYKLFISLLQDTLFYFPKQLPAYGSFLFTTVTVINFSNCIFLDNGGTTVAHQF